MSKFQQTIKLMTKNEEGKYEPKQYKSAEFIPGAAMKEAATILDTMSKASSAEEVTESLAACYFFIATVLFEGQFTAAEFENGMDAREIAPITGKLLQSLVAGYDQTYVNTKKK